MTAQIPKRADQLVVGDRVPDEHLAFRFNQGPAQVVFVAYEDTVPLKWTFVAYRYPNGQHDSMTIRPEAVLMVHPAPAPAGLDYSRADDGETTQPIAGRQPSHVGAMTDCGLVDETVATVECSPECDALARSGAPTGLNRAWHDDQCPVVPILDALYRDSVGES